MKRIKSRITKKSACIGGGVAVFLAAGVYSYMSVGAWDDLSQRTDAYANQTTSLTSSFFAREGVSSVERRDTIRKMAEAGTLSCTPGNMSQWQASLATGLKIRQAMCYEAIEVRDALATKAASLQEYYQTTDAIAAIIATLAEDNKSVSTKSYTAKLDAVKGVVSELESVDVDNDASITVKAAALAAVKKIESAWTVVIKADTQEDKAAYEKAIKTLSASYKGLDDIAEAAASAYRQATNELIPIE